MFFLEVYRDKLFTGDIAIMWVEKDGVMGIVSNPKNVFEAVEVFIGYSILKIFKPKALKLKNLRMIMIILLIITLSLRFLFFLGYGRLHVPILPPRWTSVT